MKRFTLLSLPFLCTLILLPLFLNSNAAQFSSALLRIDRLKANTTTGGMICAQPATNATENSIQIVFPTDFTVNTTAGNWTVSTSNILSGSTPWPGIGTATNVSGKTVTFPSGDLSTGTNYCFNFSGTSTLTTGAIGDKTGTISTLNAINSLIDSTTYGVTVSSNDQISVTAEVPASPTDFEAEMALTDPASATFPQETTLTYTLTYGSNLSYNSNITVEAEWSLGTISGSGSPTVAILDYVVGSASNGYNSTPPVIDLTNRKITWTINSFPPSTTGETVTFQLKTNESYTGSSTVSFDVSGRVLGPGTQTPDSTVTNEYLYDDGISPTPTTAPTSIPATGVPAQATSSPSSTATHTLTPTTSLRVNTIEIRGVSPTSAQIYTKFNLPANLVIEYGTSINNLSERINSNTNSFQHLVSLKNLNPQTKYYFRITATTSAQTTRSELFSFTTSSNESIVKVQNNTFMAISNNLLIYSQTLADENKILPLVIIPTRTRFTFSAAFINANNIKSVHAFLRKKNALSESSYSTYPEQNLSMIETTEGHYSGQLETGNNPDLFELFFRISDTIGNIFEQKVADFRIVNPLTVLEKGSNLPIEGARVTISVYNLSTKLYEQVNESSLPIDNPELTFSDGTTDIILPQGKYRAEISAFRYKDQTVDFVLGAKTNETYPIVYLEKEPLNLFTMFQYFKQSFSDLYNFGSEFITKLSKSNRTFELIAFAAITLFIFTAFFSLLFRTHNSPKSIFHYLVSIVKSKKSEFKIPNKGVIKDENNRPVSKAIISMLKNNEVIFQTTTNLNGLFFTNGKEFDSLEINKIGFENASYPFNSQIDVKIPTFHIKRHDIYAKTLILTIKDTIQIFIGLLFEFIIVLLLLLEVLFISSFGILKVLPYLLITIALFFIYVHQILSKDKS